MTHRVGLDGGRPKSLRETAEGMGVSSDVARTFEAKALNKLRQPRMNYRVKDYVGGSDDFGGESDCAEQHQNYDWAQNGMGHNVEGQQNKHFYHYPHHMNPTRFDTNGNTGDDNLVEYERPTPESIWSF